MPPFASIVKSSVGAKVSSLKLRRPFEVVHSVGASISLVIFKRLSFLFSISFDLFSKYLLFFRFDRNFLVSPVFILEIIFFSWPMPLKNVFSFWSICQVRFTVPRGRRGAGGRRRGRPVRRGGRAARPSGARRIRRWRRIFVGGEVGGVARATCATSPQLDGR